jgi:hypothetical protein
MIDFDEALDEFAKVIYSVLGRRVSEGRFVRDVFGRLSFIGSDSLVSDDDVANAVRSLNAELKPFLAPHDPIFIARTPLAVSILVEAGIAVSIPDTGYHVQLIDRRLAGEDWLRPPPSAPPKIPRFAFYGLKGGVGRSTALAVSAAEFANAGSNVLVLDLDLEAPGQASLLLDRDRVPDYGIVDWFALGALGLEQTVPVTDLIGGSPFTSGAGIVDVVPAFGGKTASHPASYLSKLARAYTPGATAGRLLQKGFTEKVEILLSDLLEYRTYDIVLLDVRAGLHETAAASIIGLGADVFFFGVNSSQTIEDYRVLFATLRSVIESSPRALDLRDRFKMVQAKALNESDRSLYRAMSWELWLDYFYDEAGDVADPNQFTFDLDDEEGPHYPMVIANSEVYAGFDPRRLPELLGEIYYRGVFSGFLSGFRKWKSTP